MTADDDDRSEGRERRFRNDTRTDGQDEGNRPGDDDVLAGIAAGCQRAPGGAPARPDVSIRPKIPAILTVSAESSPCSGDSLTTSTGTCAVPMVSSRIWASVRCLVRTRMIAPTTAMERPAPIEDRGDEGLGRANSSCVAANMAALTARPGGAPASRRALRTVARPPGRAGSAGGGAAGSGRGERRSPSLRKMCGGTSMPFSASSSRIFGRRPVGHEAAHAFGGVDPVEDVLEQDGVALHALDLGDGVHHTGTGRPSAGAAPGGRRP